MRAIEARNLSACPKYCRVMGNIEDRAKRGYSYCNYPGELSTSAIMLLRHKGYNVTYEEELHKTLIEWG